MRSDREKLLNIMEAMYRIETKQERFVIVRYFLNLGALVKVLPACVLLVEQ